MRRGFVFPRWGPWLRAALAAMLATLAATAAGDVIDVQKSSIKVTARQMNVPFDGFFRLFKADIVWDERKPESSKATIDVDLSSFDLGEPSFNDEAKGKAFLNVAGFPRASFGSSAIKSLGGGRFEATGKLTIKGVARDIAVPFTVKDDGGRRVFEATFPLKRLDYRIGEGEWSDTKTLANETTVQVRLVAATTSK